MKDTVETIEVLDRIPIVECGEPLVVVQEVCPGVEAGERPLFLRQSAAERGEVTTIERKTGLRIFVSAGECSLGGE